MPDVYKEIKDEAIKRIQGPDASHYKVEWEKHYDSIGMSLQEMKMRHSAKLRAKAAQTVRDVAAVVQGTYFDTNFTTEDDLRSWSYFDPTDLSVTPLKGFGGGWQADESQEKVRLNPDARVRYTGSGEDVHGFVILDPP